MASSARMRLPIGDGLVLWQLGKEGRRAVCHEGLALAAKRDLQRPGLRRQGHQEEGRLEDGSHQIESCGRKSLRPSQTSADLAFVEDFDRNQNLFARWASWCAEPR